MSWLEEIGAFVFAELCSGSAQDQLFVALTTCGNYYSFVKEALSEYVLFRAIRGCNLYREG